MPDQIYKVSWNGQEKINYTYDGLGRLTNKSVILSASEESQPPRLNNQYTYIDVGTDKTTTLVQSVQTAAGTYTYTYDAVGNILSASDGTYTNSYVYDSLNQLVRENNRKFGKTYTYAYVNGNITERKEYAYTTGELGTPQSVYNWSYGDGTWSDLLTAWNEGTASTASASSAASAFSLQNTAISDETAQSFFKRALQRSAANSNVSRAARTASTADTTNTTPSFSYDEIGNPTEIFDLQFSWNGRQLTSITVPDDPYVSRVDFGYNMDGQRISRTFTAPDGTVKTTEYFYNGENLAGEKTGDRTVVYMYDNSGDIFGFTVNGRAYYYVKNAQNDVTAITDSNGTVVVRYYYDAWGEPNYTHYSCSNEQTLDDVKDNPILYRSYYYDHDSGFYYLNSRYYVPMFCRFLNGDDDEVLFEDQDSLVENNLFAYCLNNPVNMADDDGTVAWWIAAAAAGAAWDAAFYCVEAAITGNFSWKGLGKAALKGAVTGLAFGAVGKIAGKAYKAVKVARSVKKASKVKKSSKVCSVLTKITKKSFCFVAGTEVLTDHGLVPIEEIQIGDLVWAEDPDTGEKTLKPVVQLFVSETHELVRLLIEDEIILATTGHPFHVKGKGWVPALDLEPGDLVTQKDGKLATVYGVWYIYSENPVTVYNFEVADFHTYFVGDDSLLVHNKGPCSTIRKVNPTKQTSGIWKKLNSAKNGLKTSGKGKNLRYYSWDNLHNEIEVFDRTGKHLGVMDPVTGEMIKNAVKGRRLW